MPIFSWYLDVLPNGVFRFILLYELTTVPFSDTIKQNIKPKILEHIEENITM